MSTGNVNIQAGGLYVGNGMTVYGNTQLQYSPAIFSDRNLKDNIMPLHDSLNKVTKLRGVSFSWNNDNKLNFDSDRHVGMIAQEVREVYPEFVHKMSKTETDTETDGYLGISYPDMIPVVVEAVKELNHKIDHLSYLFRVQSNSSNIATTETTKRKVLTRELATTAKTHTRRQSAQRDSSVGGHDKHSSAKAVLKSSVNSNSSTATNTNNDNNANCKDLLPTVKELMRQVRVLETVNKDLVRRLYLQSQQRVNKN